LTIDNSTISNNGGGIFNDGTMRVSNSTISGNNAYGGIHNNGTLTVSNTTISGNRNGYGGGIENYGMLTISVATITGNYAEYQGGGIYNVTYPGYEATLTLSNSTVSANSTGISEFNEDEHTYEGGGIFNAGTLSVTNSTLNGNTSQLGGSVSNHGTVTISSTTITVNRVNGSYFVPYASGGGIRNLGTLNMRNSIVAFNDAPVARNLYGSLASSGYNLFGDPQGGSGFVSTDLLNVDPLLGPLQNNGGPTQTMALLPGSPALNAGDPAQLGTADQRGVVRTGGVNIGAYQASASAFVLTASAAVTAGTPFDVTVKAVDTFGQVAFGYTGTVTFSVKDPDPAVVLPFDYTFTADDQGTHTFTSGITLITPGTWTLTVADLANGLSEDVILTVSR
jgi:hypothetical protein